MRGPSMIALLLLSLFSLLPYIGLNHNLVELTVLWSFLGLPSGVLTSSASMRALHSSVCILAGPRPVWREMQPWQPTV